MVAISAFFGQFSAVLFDWLFSPLYHCHGKGENGSKGSLTTPVALDRLNRSSGRWMLPCGAAASGGRPVFKGTYPVRVIALLIWAATILQLTPAALASAAEFGAEPVYVVGGDFNYPPYEFLDENGEPRGFNVDLTRAVAEAAGVKVKIRLGAWSKIREDLEAGRIDMVHGMFYSRQRDLAVDFSQPHSIISHVAFGTDSAGAIRSPDDLRGRTLAVMRGDIMHDYAIDNGLAENLVTVDNQEQALRLVSAGQADYALVAELPGMYWIDDLGIANISKKGSDLKVMEYCFAVPEGANQELLARFSEGLAKVQKSGVYRELVGKWFGSSDIKHISRRLFFINTSIFTGVLCLVALGVFVWSRTLRRKVASRTRSLEKERARLAAVVQNFPNGALYVVDEDLRFTTAGGEGLQEYGPSPERLIGRRINEVIPKEAADIIEPMYEAALAGERRNAEIEMGGEIYRFRTMPFFDSETSERRALGMTQVITESKRLVAAMADRELRWRVMWNTIQAGLVVVDRETREVLEINGPGADMIGVDREDIVGRPCYNFICPDNYKQCPLKDQECPHLENAERVMVDVTGKRIPILKSVASFHYEGRECLIESFLDISKLKETQDLLENQTAKLTSLVDSMPEFIIYKDLAGAYMGCNLSFTTLMGIQQEDIAGHYDHDLFPDELGAFLSRDDEFVLNEGESRGYEETLEVPGLGQRRMEMTKVPYQRENGDQIGLIGVVRDVTDRHRLEVLKEDVDHIMRHDLRSPLNGIKGIVGVIKADEGSDPAEMGEWLNLLESEADRMNRLIDTSLCMIKMEQGSYEFDPRPVDVVPIAKKLEHELHSLLKSKKLELSLRVNGVKPGNDTRFEVLGDDVLVHSMLGNLVRNSAEASPKGETVYVDAWFEGSAKILIRNKGEVPESVRGRFFDKYATAGKKGGTGLGTYSARLIAENFGGRISMITSSEAGTAVTLELQPASSLGKLINLGDYLSKTG